MLISLNSTEEYDNQDQDDYLNQTDYQDQGHDYHDHDDLDYQSEDCTPVSCGMHSNKNNNNKKKIFLLSRSSKSFHTVH